MSKKSVIKTIETLVSSNNLVWVNTAHWQGSNQEQTNTCSWCLREEDYEFCQNEYGFYPELSKWKTVQLIRFLNYLNSYKFKLGELLLESSTDTFGEDAGVERLWAHPLYNGVKKVSENDTYVSLLRQGFTQAKIGFDNTFSWLDLPKNLELWYEGNMTTKMYKTKNLIVR